MGEKVNIDIQMTNLAQTVSGLESMAGAMSAISKSVSNTATAGKSFGEIARARMFGSGNDRTIRSDPVRGGPGGMTGERLGRQIRGGAMIGMMGVEAGLGMVNAAFGDGPMGGVIKQGTGIIGAAATGAATGGMVGGPWGAVVGGGLGLLTSAISALTGSSKSAADAINEQIKALEKEIATTEKQVSTQFSLAAATSASGYASQDMADQVQWLADNTLISADAMGNVLNAMGDNLASQSAFAMAMSRDGANQIALLMQKYGVSAEQMGKLVIAADEAGVPLRQYTDLLTQQGQAFVMAGKGSMSDYFKGAIGGISRGDTGIEMAASAILGPKFGSVTDVLASGNVSESERKAREALGVTAGMGVDEQRAVLASAAAGGADLKGTGVEQFREVLAQFAQQGPQFETLAKSLELSRTVQGDMSKAMTDLTAAFVGSATATRNLIAAIEADRSTYSADDEMSSLTGNDQSGGA